MGWTHKEEKEFGNPQIDKLEVDDVKQKRHE